MIDVRLLTEQHLPPSCPFSPHHLLYSILYVVFVCLQKQALSVCLSICEVKNSTIAEILSSKIIGTELSCLNLILSETSEGA